MLRRSSLPMSSPATMAQGRSASLAHARRLGVFGVVGFYFDSPYGSLRSVDVGGVVQAFHSCEHGGKLLEVASGEFGSQGCVFRHFGQLYSFKERFHIKTGAAYHDGHLSACLDVGHGRAAVAQILEQIVFRSSIGYVDKMILHVRSVVGKVFSCADVHSPVYLS